MANEADVTDASRALREVYAFFVLTFAISWGSGALFLAFHGTLEPIFGRPGPLNPIFLLAACAPTLSAVALSALRGTLRELFSRIVRPVNTIWIAIAALYLPLMGLALIFMPDFGFGTSTVSPRTILVSLPIALFATPLLLTNTGPLGEELGWRGYALPRLLKCVSPLAAAGIIGVVWAIWHIPAFFIAGVMGQSLEGFGVWALDTVALSVVMTWLFLRANGNVVVAGMIPHFVINGMGSVGAWLSRPPEAAALAILAVCLVAFDANRFLRGPAGQA